MTLNNWKTKPETSSLEETNFLEQTYCTCFKQVPIFLFKLQSPLGFSYIPNKQTAVWQLPHQRKEEPLQNSNNVYHSTLKTAYQKIFRKQYKLKFSGMDFKRMLNSNSLEEQRWISLSAVQN